MSEEKVIIDKMKTEDSVELAHADLPASLNEIDPKIEARIRRKYDLRIMPIVTLIYLMAFIDRYNILLYNS